MKSLLIAVILSNAIIQTAPNPPSSVIDSLILACLNDIKRTKDSYWTGGSFYVVKNRSQKGWT